MDAIVRHIGDVCGREPSVRRVDCRLNEAGTEHAVLRRLLGLRSGEPLPLHETQHAALTLVEKSLAQAPLVLAFGDAQWCDEGTLRFIDRLMRGPAQEPLTVLLSLAPGVPAPTAPAFHELMARDCCSVTDGSDLWPTGATPPSARDAVPLGRRDSRLLRVARAAALLRSTDPHLVGPLAGLPLQVTGRLLEAARDLGLLPTRMPARGVPPQLDALMAALPDTEGEQLRAQAAEILNDAARPAGQVAELLLGLRSLDRPWMRALLKEAAATARRDHPATAATYLHKLHESAPADLAVRTELAAVLTDIDPAAALEHLDSVLSRTDDPPTRALAARQRRLTALMTHRTPDTPEGLGELLRGLRECASPLSCGGPTDDLALAARALRTALTGADQDAAVADAHQVLRTGRPRATWARVAAAQVLALAGDTTAALGHLDRTVMDSRRREEAWAQCHAGSVRALLLLESGRADDAVEAARAASRLAEGPDRTRCARLAPISLALTLVARGDLDRSESVLRRLDGHAFDGSVWEHHLHLTARAFVERGRGRTEQALRLMEQCGADLTAAGIKNPLFTTWWLHSTELLMALGRTGDAAERAELGRDLAERWPTSRSTGLSLLARGMVATGADRVELLAESVRVLQDSSDQHSRALAEMRLGTTLWRLGDEKAARGRLHAARATAVRCGLTAVAGQARVALAAAGGRPASVALSKAERPVAEMAAAGATNRTIADTLCLTVRTIEYHLTSVYRKLGVTGRAGLAHRLASPGAHGSARLPGEER
ncbi:LuxR C-terminal-related transcriptional regulator [Streptomyces sp. NPDC005969]|uniref:LuxR C-terminal-related transcriptional regulator n=1 Tax=Streptomyces sp. NPDC005969 TaxID=3156722 RepID=UPI0033FA0D32